MTTMTIKVGKCINTGSLPASVVKDTPTFLATDEYGRLQTVSQSDTAALTNGTQKTQIIDNTLTGSASLQTVISGSVYSLRTADQFIPGAEDNTNNVIWVHQKPLSGSINAPSYYQTTSLTVTGSVKAATSKLFKISGHVKPQNSEAQTEYVHLYNTTAVPADTAVPKFVLPVTLGANLTPVKFEYEFCNHGILFDTGCAWALSRTAESKLTTTGSQAWMQISYV